MQIRKDLAEKKLSVLQQDYEVNVTKLQKQHEDVSQQLQKLVSVMPDHFLN
jgi:dynactin 1